MLWYLDGRVNHRANMAEKPNENYARELLELHTLGVHGGYTQTDVMEVARCLTGWTVRSTEQPPYFQIGKIDFHRQQHDFGAKEVLGETIPAASAGLNNQELERWGRNELDHVLHIVTRHPSTAAHIAFKLCRRFIADEPPRQAIERVASVFQRTSGDIRATVAAVFDTPEFRERRGTKFKRPFQFVASALRATAARTDSGLELIDYLTRMGHAPHNYPTPEGYPQEAAPWMGTLFWRWKFAVALSQNRIRGTQVDFEKLRQHSGGEEKLRAHLLGRQATAREARACRESGAELALLLASPAFQRC
jgi:uncharacterized protein (DUF1800 family)